MATFAARDGGAALSFEGHEGSLLRQLVEEMSELLDEPVPTDPAVARLFPAAYEDPAEAAAFKELIGNELSSGKRADLDKVARALDGREAHDEEVVIPRDDLEAWLRALTDMRLALGTRLDVDEEKMSRELDPADASAGSMAVLHWLGWIQESLLEILTRRETT
ncbi:MAG TPA: DUF2017 family protein [Actinomycetota bacterium]|nr:DUF2017 family protein [Actinomycetota bacterium]